MKPSKQQIHALRVENMRYGTEFVEIPRCNWVSCDGDPAAEFRQRVFRNHQFLVQIFVEADGAIRLTINRTDVDSTGRWRQDITWDDLQRIKGELGFRQNTAIEVFPPDEYLVNVANMRHLWITPSVFLTTVPVWGLNRIG